MDRELKIKKLFSLHNLWLVCAVNHNSPWPRDNHFVTYSGMDFVLLGLYRNSLRKSGASIIMPLANKEETDKKLKILNDFCAELSWLEQGYVKIVRCIVTTSLGWGCEGDTNISASFVGTSNYSLLHGNLEKHKSLALALWNDALALESDYIFCSFLQFYKIIESQFEEKQQKCRINWINLGLKEIELESSTISITQDSRINMAMEYLIKETNDIGDYLYRNGRCSIAHASLDKLVANPNNPSDIKKISMATILMKALAKKYIKKELNILTNY
jgi:hypothetical protein